MLVIHHKDIKHPIIHSRLYVNKVQRIFCTETTYQSLFPSFFSQLHKVDKIQLSLEPKNNLEYYKSLGDSDLLLRSCDELRICISKCSYLIDSNVDLVKCEPSPHITTRPKREIEFSCGWWNLTCQAYRNVVLLTQNYRL